MPTTACAAIQLPQQCQANDTSWLNDVPCRREQNLCHSYSLGSLPREEVCQLGAVRLKLCVASTLQKSNSIYGAIRRPEVIPACEVQGLTSSTAAAACAISRTLDGLWTHPLNLQSHTAENASSGKFNKSLNAVVTIGERLAQESTLISLVAGSLRECEIAGPRNSMLVIRARPAT